MPASPADIKIIQDLLRPGRWEGQTLKSSGELALAVGSHFLGTPYAAGTLEQGKRERLQINLRQLDCFTFVENTMALARLIRLGKSSFADFAASLEAIRYRKGLLDGYPSRLHYFSDWLYDNQEKGWIKDITKEIGGEPFRKQFSFMTANNWFLFHRLNCQMACAGSAHLTLLTLTATAVPRLWCLGNKFWAIKTKPVDSRDRIFSGPDSEYLIGPSKIVPLRSRLLFLLP